MSSHFTYEIDERRLRVKLKELELPHSEEAWQSFESFTGSQARHNHNALSTIQLPLNRNVIVPAVFGLLIVVFSVILFRFININTAPQQAPVQEMAVPAPESTPAPATPASAGTSTQPVTNQVTPTAGPTASHTLAKQAATPTSATVAGNNAPQQATKPLVTNTLTTSAPKPTAKSSSTSVPTSSTTTLSTAGTVNGTNTATEPGVKKKRKRRSAEEVESEPATETRPAIDADERSVGERPN